MGTIELVGLSLLSVGTDALELLGITIDEVDTG